MLLGVSSNICHRYISLSDGAGFVFSFHNPVMQKVYHREEFQSALVFIYTAGRRRAPLVLATAPGPPRWCRDCPACYSIWTTIRFHVLIL